MSDQPSLFEPNAVSPEGFRYAPNLIDEEEERALVSEIARLPFRAFQFSRLRGEAARRVVRLAVRLQGVEASRGAGHPGVLPLSAGEGRPVRRGRRRRARAASGDRICAGRVDWLA